MHMALRTRISKNDLVHYDDRVVGEIIRAPGGYAYRHFSFKLKKPSSAMTTVAELLPHIDGFLTELYK